MNEPTRTKHVFGYTSCEREQNEFSEKYWDYFFFEAPFNLKALDKDTYLISGRRGTGKTSLISYLTQAENYRQAAKIIISGQEICKKFKLEFITNTKLKHMIGQITSEEQTQIVSHMAHELIKSIIFSAILQAQETTETTIEFQHDTSLIPILLNNLDSHASITGIAAGVASFIKHREQSQTTTNEKAVRKLIADKQFRQTIIAIDSLEQYDPHSKEEMCFLSELIEFVASIGPSLHPSVYFKIFIGAEAFTYISQSIIRNPAKYIDDVLHLNWRSRDLTRLIAWRFSRYMNENPDIEFNNISCKEHCSTIDYKEFNSTYECFWKPYFGETLINKCDKEEKVYPYIMRHTQFRPRQIVMICNMIAELAHERNCFPYFNQQNIIRDAVSKLEKTLALDVINAYEKMYPRIGHIIQTCFSQCEILMTGQDLDEISKRGAALWKDMPDTSYEFTRDFFREVVTRIGIIGRVRSYDEVKGIVSADFQYTMAQQLFIPGDSTQVVIHPMFFDYLSVHANRKKPLIIYPFSPDNVQLLEIVGVQEQ